MLADSGVSTRDAGASAILCPFAYQCVFRLRPNAHPKPEYARVLLMDADAPFVVMKVGIRLEGRNDESQAVLKRYQISVAPKVPSMPMDYAKWGWDVLIPIRFRPSEIVNLVLSRDAKTKLLKLRKIEDGGGVNVFVTLNGVKEYQL